MRGLPSGVPGELPRMLHAEHWQVCGARESQERAKAKKCARTAQLEGNRLNIPDGENAV